MPLPAAFVALVNSDEFNTQRAAHDDAGIAATLNVFDQRGLIPIVELSRYTAKGIAGGVQALIEIPIGAAIAPNVLMDIPTKGALYTVMNMARADFRLDYCDVDDPVFSSVCDMLVSFGVMQHSDKVAILALGANRQSRAMAALATTNPDGTTSTRSCTAVDVEHVRKGNN